jgi:hypothetical protein
MFEVSWALTLWSAIVLLAILALLVGAGLWLWRKTTRPGKRADGSASVIAEEGRPQRR